MPPEYCGLRFQVAFEHDWGLPENIFAGHAHLTAATLYGKIWPVNDIFR